MSASQAVPAIFWKPSSVWTLSKASALLRQHSYRTSVSAILVNHECGRSLIEATALLSSQLDTARAWGSASDP